jgi:hypothetical protein
MNQIKTKFAEFKLMTGYNHDPDKRGPLIREVDACYEAYETYFPTYKDPTDQGIVTASLYIACTRWLKQKEGKLHHRQQFLKPTVPARTPTRRKWVTKVAKQCLVELAAAGWFGDDQARVKFETRKLATHKLKPQEWRTTLPLHGSYAYERETWEKSKKQSALSASVVSEVLKNTGKQRKFDQLTLDDYKKLANKEQVVFFKRDARLKRMVGIDAAGLLCNAKTMVHLDFNVPQLDFPKPPLYDNFIFLRDMKNRFEPALMMYAMDRYGNLFYGRQPSTEEIHFRYGEEFSRYNHSTFNAGHKVICAGNIGINKGKLVWIDNGSGHYRPTKDNLKGAIGILDVEEVDLSETVVGVFYFDGQGNKIKCEYFRPGDLLSDGKPFYTY